MKQATIALNPKTFQLLSTQLMARTVAATARINKGAPTSSSPSSDMRTSLLELAKQLFSERGYVAASLRDLAEMAGVTAAAVYYHFAKKEDLLRQIVFDGLEQITREVMNALAGAGSPEARLEAVIRAHLRYNVECPRDSKIIIEEARYLNEVDYAAAREKQLGVLNAYRACIQQLQEFKRMPGVDSSLAAFGITSVILGWYRWYRPSGPLSKEAAFEYMVSFAKAGALHALDPASSAACRLSRPS